MRTTKAPSRARDRLHGLVLPHVEREVRDDRPVVRQRIAARRLRRRRRRTAVRRARASRRSRRSVTYVGYCVMRARPHSPGRRRGRRARAFCSEIAAASPHGPAPMTTASSALSRRPPVRRLPSCPDDLVPPRPHADVRDRRLDKLLDPIEVSPRRCRAGPRARARRRSTSASRRTTRTRGSTPLQGRDVAGKLVDAARRRTRSPVQSPMRSSVSSTSSFVTARSVSPLTRAA